MPYLQQYGASFVAAADGVMFTLEGLMLTLAAGAIVFLIILGMLLRYSGLGRRLGSQLLEGGVIIAIFISFVVPWLNTVYCLTPP